MKKVLITVDTEGPAGKDAVRRLIYGETAKGEKYGIDYLIDTFNKFGAKALFFVDIAEAWDRGFDDIIRVLRVIEESGHNTAVHVHPDHMADPNRRFLWQYNYEEQKDIISKCTELYENALGKKPCSFRAGRYGANNDTIRIIDELGYKYDMSAFFRNKRCRLEPAISINRVGRFFDTSIIEVPVTVYRSFSVPFYSRVDKIDCNMYYNEFITAMNEVIKCDDVDVVSYFVHSFSLLNWRGNPDSPTLNNKLKNSFLAQMQWFACDEFSFISEDDLSLINPYESKVLEEIPRIDRTVRSFYYFFRKAISVTRDRIVRNV